MAKEKLELKAIQELIASSEANWEAGITTVSELTELEKKRMLGYVPGPDAVSYTHLDVYKRQVLRLSAASRSAIVRATFKIRS